MIRPFGLRDVLLLKQLEPQGVAFDLRRWLLGAPSSTCAALTGYITQSRMGMVTCVQDGRGGRAAGLQGFVQAWPRWARAEWDLAFLSPSLDHGGTVLELWQDLLSALILHGAAQHIERIYARSAEDSETEEIFRQAGFTIVTREDVFVLSGVTTPAPQPRGLRKVTVHDSQPLNELHYQVVPQMMSKNGTMPAGHVLLQYPWPHSWNRGDYVWVEKGRIVAHLQLFRGIRGAWLEVVVRPEYRADTLPCIRYMLTLAQEDHETPIYCPVPDYAVGLGWLLRTLGFELYARQVLLVAHTVSCVPVSRRLVVPGLNTGVEPGLR